MPAGSSSDDIVLRLILKGQDPSEAARLAGMSFRALEGELNASISRQAAAYKQAAEAATASAQKESKERIKAGLQETKEITQAIQEMERQQKKAAQGMSTNWHRTMEDLENITTVARAAWDVILGGAGRLKDLGESIDKVTNIYGSLKGSIDQMREASGGQIADIDLIAAKNRALQKELTLTDEQFGVAAAGADIFADAVGVSTKEALDSVIDSLATGRLRGLAAAGVVVSEKEAYEDYAKAIGVASDQLSEHQQLVAKAEAALRALDKKVIENAGNIENFADKWEQGMAKISNLGDEMKLGIGQAVIWLTDKFEAFTDGMTKSILELQVFFAKAKDIADHAIHPFSYTGNDTRQAIHDAQMELEGHLDRVARKETDAAEAAAKRVAAANDRVRRDTNPRMSDLKMFGGGGLPYDAENAVGGDRTPPKAPKGPAGDASGYTAFWDRIKYLQDNTDKKLFQRLDDEDLAAKEYEKYLAAQEHGVEGATGTRDDSGKVFKKIQSQTFHPGEYAGYSSQEVSPEKVNQLKELGRSLVDVDGHKETTGPGIFEKLMFGPTGAPDVLYDKMTEAQKMTFDATKAMSDSFKGAGDAMASGFGQAAAAAIGENKNFLQGLKETTHQMLMSLSAQAYARAAWETALGLAALAGVVTAGDAAPHFIAAAAFAGVGTAAGLGARATYSGTGSTPAASKGSSAGSGVGSSSSLGPSGGNTSMTYIFNGAFLTEPDALAKLVSKSVIEATGKNGRPPPGFIGGSA